jgi:hypothetical protein
VVLDALGATLATGKGPLSYWRQTVPLAELEAVKVAVLSTTGDITVVLDNAVVVSGIRKGPSARHDSNAHSWKLFWECVGSRRVTAIKIKSHLDEPAALRAGVEHLHWEANRLADELADAAALEAQLPPEAVMAVQMADQKAFLVQEHLLAVAAAVAQDAARLYGPSTRLERAREARARAQTRKEELEALLSTTAHRWCEATNRCLNCLVGPSRVEPLREFLASPCSGRPRAIHESHALQRHRGLWFCDRCGASGSRRFTARGLGGPCHPPTAYGLSVLSRIREGRLPAHRRAWPDEEEENLSGLILESS